MLSQVAHVLAFFFFRTQRMIAITPVHVRDDGRGIAKKLTCIILGDKQRNNC